MIDLLHITSGLDAGGAERMLVQLVAGLRARGFSQHVVSLAPGGLFASDLRATGVALTQLDAQSWSSLPRTTLGLLAVIRRCRPRVLQGWMYHGNVAASLGHALRDRRAGSTLVWNIRASNMDAKRYGRILRLSAVISSGVDLMIANSEAGLKFHGGIGFRPRRSLVIRNGIDTARYRPDRRRRAAMRASLGIAEDAIVAMQVARLDPMKDHATFLKALSAVPEVTGVLVGKGTECLSGPPNVLALGHREEVDALLAGTDLIVSTSAFGEGFSNAIAEGMSAGAIPIATPIGDARTILGETGAIVETANPDAVANALRIFAALPLNERQARSAAVRERIIALFGLDQAVSSFARVYADHY